MANSHIIDRKLKERAKLTFFFPRQDKFQWTMVILPFCENPVIKESKRARYQKYSIVSRSSNLYSYLGADSRKLALSFNITLPHLLEEHPELLNDLHLSINKLTMKHKYTLDPSLSIGYSSKSVNYARGMFKKGMRSAAMQVLNSDWGTNRITQEEIDYIKNFYGLGADLVQTEEGHYMSVDDSIVAGYGSYYLTPPGSAFAQSDKASQILSDSQKKKFTIIDLIIYWVNIIRSSVVNSSSDPVYGPPVIRLTHGLMYQNIPCICTDYTLDWDERAGYDLETLLPRRLNITMNLEEFRTGDFEDFDQNNPIKRDNLAGWEYVVDGPPHTMDSGYDVNTTDNVSPYGWSDMWGEPS